MYKVVLVDDCSIEGELYKEKLKSGDYDIVLVTDPLCAERVILEEKPDMVILDLYMPDLDGIALAKIVRANGDIPIIFITGSNNVEDLKACMRVGAIDLLHKPVDRDTLRSTVRAHTMHQLTSKALSPLLVELTRVRNKYLPTGGDIAM